MSYKKKILENVYWEKKTPYLSFYKSHTFHIYHFWYRTVVPTVFLFRKQILPIPM